MTTDRELLNDVKIQIAWLGWALASLPQGTKISVPELDRGDLAGGNPLAGDPTCDDRIRLAIEVMDRRPPQLAGPCHGYAFSGVIEPDPLVRIANDAIDKLRQLEERLPR